MTSYPPSKTHKRLYIQEVVTRDGFQAESSFIPTEQKIALINRLSHAGYAKIEVSSFTSPKAIPMLADAFLQIFTSYLSNSCTRIFTGFLFGLVEGGFVIGVLSHIAYMIKNRTK